MCSERIQLPLHRERTYGKNRRTTVKNLSEKEWHATEREPDSDGDVLHVSQGAVDDSEFRWA